MSWSSRRSRHRSRLCEHLGVAPLPVALAWARRGERSQPSRSQKTPLGSPFGLSVDGHAELHDLIMHERCRLFELADRQP